MRTRGLTVAVLAATIGVAGCGATTSSNKFSGEQQAVAQTVDNLNSDGSSNDAAAICNNVFASSVVKRLDASGGCQTAVKNQLKDAEVFDVSVQSNGIAITAKTCRRAKCTLPTATAQVKSTCNGVQQPSTLSLVKEAPGWRIASLSTACPQPAPPR